MKKVAFHNLGCKVNTYELDAIMQLLENDGYTVVPFENKADVYVINTCTVTNIADRKSRQMLHKAKKANPDSIIVAVGCYVQTKGVDALKEQGIDICIGNNHKTEIIQIINKYVTEKENQCKISDLSKCKDYEDMTISSTAEHSRAFIKIQDGCNQFCTYCIIPYARGRVRSRKPEDIINEIENLTGKEYKEFVLTGIHLSSYGTDFDFEDIKADRFGEKHLCSLFEKINNIEGVKRIRLGSLEPRIITEEFCQAISKLDKLCPHFHLSLQSGCNKTLKRMNRHYTAEEFYDKVCLLRKYFEHPAITTDIIVGFPGETQEEFEETRQFVSKVNFFETHIFKYSRRKGTPADTMPMQLTDAEKSLRSDVLEKIDISNSNEFRKFYIGKNVDVLFEEEKEINGEKYWVGHTKEYVKVLCKSEDDLNNVILNVNVYDMLNDNYVLSTIQN